MLPTFGLYFVYENAIYVFVSFFPSFLFIFRKLNRNMKQFVVVFVGLLAAVNAVSFFDVVREEWHAFKVRLKP